MNVVNVLTGRTACKGAVRLLVEAFAADPLVQLRHGRLARMKLRFDMTGGLLDAWARGDLRVVADARTRAEGVAFWWPVPRRPAPGAALARLGATIVVLATPPAVVAAAARRATGRNDLAAALLLIGTLAGGAFLYGRPAVGRAAAAADRAHAPIVAALGPHVALQVVAVAPAAQGRGIGAALLDACLVDADARRLPVVLTTANPNARALYERRGFRVTHETTITRNGAAAMYALLVRPAQTVGAHPLGPAMASASGGPQEPGS
jgi:ribosomal protein S18 acetylase RimI-like enzyme